MNDNVYPNYSVLMSVYYKEKPEWFDSSIKSMLNQTVCTNEFVIVKDGPLTSELDDVINKYTKLYPNLFKIIPIEKNGGLGPALKLGVENCTNEYIARMDSDDISVPTRIEKELKLFMDDPSLGIVGSNIIEFYDDLSNETGRTILPENYEQIKLFARKRNPFRHPTIIFKKSEILKAGNYRQYYLFEDYDIWVRMLKNNCKCYNIQEFLVYMRVSPDFYKRRGGVKYLKSVRKFWKEQRKNKFINFFEYYKTMIPRTIICLLPNFLRDFIYRKLLRSKKKD